MPTSVVANVASSDDAARHCWHTGSHCADAPGVVSTSLETTQRSSASVNALTPSASLVLHSDDDDDDDGVVNVAPQPSSSQTHNVGLHSAMAAETTTTTTTRRTFRRRIVLIRHGQSEANVAGASPHIFDPTLTEAGREQAAHIAKCLQMPQLEDDDENARCRASFSPPISSAAPVEGRRSALPSLHQISMVFASTLSRALQTASIIVSAAGGGGRVDDHHTTTHRRSAECAAALPQQHTTQVPLPRHGVVVMALEELREVVGKECIAELRRPRSVLQKLFPDIDVASCVPFERDPMCHLAVDMERREAGPGERRVALEARAKRVWHSVRHLAPPPEGVEEDAILIVSHYHFLQYLCMQIATLRRGDDDADDGGYEQDDDGDGDGHRTRVDKRFDLNALTDWPNGATVTVDLTVVHQQQAEEADMMCPPAWLANSDASVFPPEVLCHDRRSNVNVRGICANF